MEAFEQIDVWIYKDSDLKTVFWIHEDWTTDCPIKMQPLHKVFLFYPECTQITNNMISTLVCFSKSPMSDTMLEATGQHIPKNI
jgi:hypothetical protein